MGFLRLEAIMFFECGFTVLSSKNLSSPSQISMSAPVWLSRDVPNEDVTDRPPCTREICVYLYVCWGWAYVCVCECEYVCVCMHASMYIYTFSVECVRVRVFSFIMR